MLYLLKKMIKKNKILYKITFNLYRWYYINIRNFISKEISLKQKINYKRCARSAKKGLPLSQGHPVLLCIEPTNCCNLKCPICETGADVLGREKKMMNLRDFKYILDQFDENLTHMFFYFMGEPFLNREGYEMVRYAVNRGIWVSTCVNAGFIDPQKLVDSGISEVNFQIAGMTQEVHEIYRVNSKLKDVFTALEETIRLKNKSDSKNKDMKIIVGYILMKHNEHQVEDFKDYCKKIGVDDYNIIGTTARTAEQFKKYMPTDKDYHRFISEEAYEKNKLVPRHRPDNYCGWIYSSTTIMVNGDVVPCCYDPTGKYVLGNVFHENFYDIWNNEKYQYIRKQVANDSNNFDLCQLCFGEKIPPIIR